MLYLYYKNKFKSLKIIKAHMKNLYTNKKAFHNYFILQKFEAGIVLTGSEVKSCKHSRIDLTDSYVSIDRNELILHNSFIAHYKNSGYVYHIEKQDRKLLMHKKEILKFKQDLFIKGLTLIPLAFYLKNGLIKVEIALAKGKHNYDKREDLKEKETKKEIKKFV